MELQTLGWILAGWFAVSVVVSLALGWFIREVNTSPEEAELDQVLSQRRIVRYMRGRNQERGVAATDKLANKKSRRQSQ